MSPLVISVQDFRANASFQSSSLDSPSFNRVLADFDCVTGPTPTLHRIAYTTAGSSRNENKDPPALFHEAGVWVERTGRLEHDIYITSNILNGTSGKGKHIDVCKLTITEGCTYDGAFMPSSIDPAVQVVDGVRYSPLNHSGIVMGNGATKFKEGILFCEQGRDDVDTARICTPSSLSLFDPRTDSHAQPLLNNFYGRPFNSLNDVAVHPSGWVVVTDPSYGHDQGFKGVPQLPRGVWAWNPDDGRVNMVADCFGRPNGVAFSPSGDTCYITDTDYIHGDGSISPSRAGTIYAFDVVLTGNSRLSLLNRRVFNIVDCGAPDGIKCDEHGNVYTGCFDGVHVFNPSGDLIGRILLPSNRSNQRGGCANLVFGPSGQLIILSETSVYVARLAVRGHLEAVVLDT